jgi:hypothetical protein
VLNKYNINDKIVDEIEDRSDCDYIQDYFTKITGSRTVSVESYVFFMYLINMQLNFLS